MPKIMSYIYNKSWKLQFSASSSIIIIEDFYLQTFLHSLGLDDSMLGNVYMPDSTKIYDSNYNILLIHEPDTADSFQEYPYDLVLSGHSHGGQVNIPFIPAINQKAISSTNLAKNYVSGMYELNSKTKIYVNTGIGTTHVSGRLGVVPEISIFHIYL